MAAQQHTYIDSLKDRVRTLYDNRFLFNTIDANGNIIGYADRETGIDIIDSDNLYIHENFDRIHLNYGTDFYISYNEFMIHVIKDILFPFMLPTYQQTRNADINGQIEAYLSAEDTNLRLPGIHTPVFSNVDDIDIFIAEIYRKDISMGWISGPQGWMNFTDTLIYRIYSYLKDEIHSRDRLETVNTLILNEAELEIASQLLEKLEPYDQEHSHALNQLMRRHLQVQQQREDDTDSPVRYVPIQQLSEEDDAVLPTRADVSSEAGSDDLDVPYQTIDFDPITKTNELVDLYNLAVANGNINLEGKTHRNSQLVIELMRFLIWEHENFKTVEKYIERRLRDFADFGDDAELKALKTIDKEMERVVKREQRSDSQEQPSRDTPAETQPNYEMFHFGGKKKRKSNKRISKRRKHKAKSKKRKHRGGKNTRRISKKTNRNTNRKTKRKSNKRISKRRK